MRTFVGRPVGSRKEGGGPRRLTFSLLRSSSFLIIPSLLARRPPCRNNPDRLAAKSVDDQQQSALFRMGDQDLPCWSTAALSPGASEASGSARYVFRDEAGS